MKQETNLRMDEGIILPPKEVTMYGAGFLELGLGPYKFHDQSKESQ